MSYIDQENDKEIKEVIVDVKNAVSLFNQLADTVSGLGIDSKKRDEILGKIDDVEYGLLGKSTVCSHEDEG